MQESDTLIGLYKTMEAAISLAQANPKVLDIFDTENALRQVADYFGVSSEVVRSKNEMQRLKIRASMENALAMQSLADKPLAATIEHLKDKK
jgi:hypothetical protein